MSATPNLNAPIQAIVLAIDVVAQDGNVPEGMAAELIRMMITGIGQSCALQRTERPGEAPMLIAVIPPELPAPGLLQRTLAIVEQYNTENAPVQARLLLHHGVVFAAQEGRTGAYVGSALRSAQGALRRLPPRAAASVATRDFTEFAKAVPSLLLTLEPLADSVDPLWSVRSVKSNTATPQTERLQLNDTQLASYLSARLAEDIGPFASALVEGAVQTSRSLSALIEELAREIDDGSARKRFMVDAEAFLASRKR